MKNTKNKIRFLNIEGITFVIYTITMKKGHLTTEESIKGIRRYGMYVKKRNIKFINSIKVTFEEIKE